jgi:hypothetical protein
VDLQESHYNTYGWDLTYFLNTSLTPDMRENHITELLDTYRQALLNTLLACRRLPSDVPSVEQIKVTLPISGVNDSRVPTLRVNRNGLRKPI